jgi:hypothetical protein
MPDDTSASGAASAEGISLGDIIAGRASVNDVGSAAGASAASSALDSLTSALPDLGFTAGQNAAQGALATLTPYLPYVVIGLGVLVLMIKR